MLRTALVWNPITQQTDYKEEMHIEENNQLNYHFKGSKFDLINSYDASKYYTALKRFRLWKRIKLFLEQFDVIVNASFHRHL